jgi:HAD superfamily hydrolase (TIGR01509 family)
MVDAALLELEGVVFDTRELRLASLEEALSAHGLDLTLDPESVDGFTPRAAAAIAMAAHDSANDHVLIDLITLRAEREFSSRLAMRGAELRDGARDFVREASAMARLAVVTRARRGDVDTMLRLSALAEFFTLVVSSDDVLDGKPSGDGYRLALDRLNRRRPLPARTAIAIEDGQSGIRAAHNAGIRCVAVGPLPAYLAIEADAFVPSLAGHTTRSLDQLSRPQERVK